MKAEEWAKEFCSKAEIDHRMIRAVAAFRFLRIEITGAGYTWVDCVGPPPAGIMRELPSFYLAPTDKTGIRIIADDPDASYQELLDFADRVLG